MISPSKPVPVARRTVDGARYYDTPDGSFPSVTTILQIIGKPALVSWAARVERGWVINAAADLWEDAPLTVKMSRPSFVATLERRLGIERAHQKESQKALEIGAAVHQLIEWNLRRELGQEAGPEPRIPPAGASAFAAYERWRRDVNLIPVGIEQTVWHAHDGYAGTLDLVARIDGIITVIDFKTGKAIYPEHHLQLGAYAKALEAMGHESAARGLVVVIPKDPTIAFQVSEVKLAESYAAFRMAHALWNWISTYGST